MMPCRAGGVGGILDWTPRVIISWLLVPVNMASPTFHGPCRLFCEEPSISRESHTAPLMVFFFIFCSFLWPGAEAAGGYRLVANTEAIISCAKLRSPAAGR